MSHAARPARTNARKRKPRRSIGALFQALLVAVVGPLVTYFGICILALLLYTFVYPPVTGIQLQRLAESFVEEKPYTVRYRPVPVDRISRHVPNAVVAAEDGRFFDHGGVDWEAVQKAMEDNRRRGRLWRGGSTISQQLVKNLFMTTHSSFLRKALEIPLTYLAELILTKDRILALYVNVIEWGRGVYGIEAAAQHYYGIPAARLGRAQAASLAALIPAPRTRTPRSAGWYTNIILRRMSQMGW